MPRPQRLSKSLTLLHGTITLTPVADNVRPKISAATAWQKLGSSTDRLHRLQIVLANYSAQIPAKLTSGTNVPLYKDVPAWVILASPGTTKYSGCGLWGISEINALTGQQLGGHSYSPGP
jgi:hypothetical protein